MSKIVTVKELEDCALDAQTFGDAANGEPDVKVKARLGRVYWTLATYDKRFNDRADLFDKMYVDYGDLLESKVKEFDDARVQQVLIYTQTLNTKVDEFDTTLNQQVTKYDQVLGDKVAEYDIKINSVDAEIRDAKNTADDAKNTAEQALEQTKLDPATTEVLGGVKIGKGLKITEDGELSVSSSGLPIGTLVHHQGKRSTLPVGQLAYDGYTYKRADYPELWEMIRSGRFAKTTDSNWLANPLYRGCFTEGNGTTTFRLPDLNGAQTGSIPDLFLRGSKSDQAVGEVRNDAQRKLMGSFGYFRGDSPEYTGVSGVFSKVNISASEGRGYNGSAQTTGTRIDFDSSLNGNPTADENRPKSTYIVLAIVAKANFVEDPPEGVKPAVTVGGNDFSGAQNITGPISATGDITTQGNLNGNIKHLLNADGKAPVFALRAMAVIDGRTGALIMGRNIRSLKRHATGDYSIVFNVSMPSDIYAISLTSSISRTMRTSRSVNIDETEQPTSLGFRFQHRADGLEDASFIYLSVAV